MKDGVHSLTLGLHLHLPRRGPVTFLLLCPVLWSTYGFYFIGYTHYVMRVWLVTYSYVGSLDCLT